MLGGHHAEADQEGFLDQGLAQLHIQPAGLLKGAREGQRKLVEECDLGIELRVDGGNNGLREWMHGAPS